MGVPHQTDTGQTARYTVTASFIGGDALYVKFTIVAHGEKLLRRRRSKIRNKDKQAVREAATICLRPCKLTFDLWPLTLKVVSESRVTLPISVPILVFLGLSVLDLRPMYATDRRQTSDAHHRLMRQ